MKINKIKLGKIFFWIGMLLQLFYTGRIITINSYEKSSFFVALIILCFGVVFGIGGMSKKEMSLFIISAGIAFFHLVLADDTNLLRIVLMVFAARRIEADKIKKFLLYAYTIFFFGVVLMSIYGNFNTIYQEGVWRTNVGHEIRYNYGFDGPIRLMTVWNCFMASVFIFFKRRNIFRDIILLVVSLALFKRSVTYTGIFGSLMLLGFPYVLGFGIFRKNYTYVRIMIRGGLIFVLLLTAMASVVDVSSTGFGVWMNGRTATLYRILADGHYPRLFGGEIPKGYYGLDNSYFYCLYLLGIVPMLMMLYLIWKLAGILTLKKDLMGCSVLLSFVPIAYVTQIFEYPFLNYFLFLIMENWEDMIGRARSGGDLYDT